MTHCFKFKSVTIPILATVTVTEKQTSFTDNISMRDAFFSVVLDANVFVLAALSVEACHLTLTIYPNRPEKPRLFQFFDKRIVKKFP